MMSTSRTRASSAPPHQHLAARLGWLALLMLCVTQFCLSYFQDDRPFLNLDLYLAGRYTMPYQGRILMSWVLAAGARVHMLASIAGHLAPPLDDPRMVLVFFTSWFSLLGSVLFAGGSIAALTGDRRFGRWAAFLVIYMAYFHFPLVYGWNFLLPYDLPSLFFFSGCLYCVVTRRMAVFYPLFVLGSLNRETLIMVTLILVLWRVKDGDRAALAGHVVAQVVIWGAIRFWMQHLFRGNPIEPGSERFYYKLSGNLGFLADPRHWPVLASVFGFMLPLVVLARHRMSPAMRRCLWVLPAWFIVMLLTGVIVEIRVYAELISYMTLAVATICYNSFFRTDEQPGEAS